MIKIFIKNGILYEKIGIKDDIIILDGEIYVKKTGAFRNK